MFSGNKSAFSEYFGIYPPLPDQDETDERSLDVVDTLNEDRESLRPARHKRDIWHERRMRMLSRRCCLKSDPDNLKADGSERVCRSTCKFGDDSTLDQTDDVIKENLIHLVDQVLARDHEKRKYGLGLVGRWLNTKYKKTLTIDQLNYLNNFEDKRPFFTYWVTTVQALVLLVSILTYGFGPWGLSSSEIKDHVFVTSLSWQRASYLERDNLWIGPRAADLIHLGAKFTPCMRRDRLVYDVIDSDRRDESNTGCCIRNDRSGCLQTHRSGCSYLQSKWHSWNTTTADDAPIVYFSGKNRQSGPVCGQDPRHCLSPASVHPNEWPDDVSRWPICRKRVDTSLPSHHMSCELIGRPCCVGIHGQCRITTSQHCAFLRGTFHQEATLCSQVSCMDDVCGMVPFYARGYPDQVYRVFTALFLHAGILHFVLTAIIQMYIMRDLERLIGASRMAIIYLTSGIAGYLGSAIFVPYHTQVGPSGSQFALLALMLAELINSWEYVSKPERHLFKYLATIAGLFVAGLLPWIDNYAHLFGFITGILLSLALVPYLAPVDERAYRLKVIQVWTCLLLVSVMLVVLLLQLYVFPVYECSWCQYLDCLPLFPDWCQDQDIKIGRLDIL